MNKLPQILIGIGSLLTVASLFLFVFIFFPVAKVEVNYTLNKPRNLEIKPVDKEFGIVIPKIAANAKIISQVDPYNSNIYQIALTKGVAQARGTAYPDQIGNMFLFSHSSVNLLEATRYNSVFYLLSKLNKNDEIFIFYKNVKYKYKVSDIKIVDAKDISYLNPRSTNKELTLMTCWPAGTSYKRLLVIAESKAN
ncbi:MAG: sortase [Patescibacteria group bacterium]|nr:sortase [Patescibacteria group bacterium]